MSEAATLPPPATGAPPAPPSSASSASWANADGTFSPSFYDNLPADISGLKDDISKFKTPSELARAYAHNKHFAGQKGLIPLDATAPKEVREARKALLDSIGGVPKEAKDYGLTRPADVPEGAWDLKYVEKVSEWAHRNSVPPSAMRELLSDVVASQVKAQVAASATDQQAFWDGQARDFDTAIRLEGIQADKANALAERGATALGFDLGNKSHELILKNAAVRLAMMRHAISVGEDSYVEGEAAKGSGGDYLAQAKDASENPANPLYGPLGDPKHPQHKAVKAQVDEMWRKAQAQMDRRRIA
jgi:hypothetical protein